MRSIDEMNADVASGSVYQGAILFAGEPELLQACAGASKGPIVEIGSYRGGGTVCLARGSRAGNEQLVYAIDRHEVEGGGEFMQIDPGSDWMAWYLAVAGAGIGVASLIRPIGLWSHEALPVFQTLPALGFLFIDGDHSPEAVERDTDEWLPLLRDDGMVAFHDCNLPGPRSMVEWLVSTGVWQIAGEAGTLTVLSRTP